MVDLPGRLTLKNVVLLIFLSLTVKPLRFCVETFEVRPSLQLSVLLPQCVSALSLQPSEENCRKVSLAGSHRRDHSKFEPTIITAKTAV